MDRNDFECGDEILDVQRKPRAGVVVSIRLTADDADRLSDIAEAEDRTISYVARRALQQYLRRPPTATINQPSRTIASGLLTALTWRQS